MAPFSLASIPKTEIVYSSFVKLSSSKQFKTILYTDQFVPIFFLQFPITIKILIQGENLNIN